jgi:hypothetical protein
MTDIKWPGTPVESVKWPGTPVDDTAKLGDLKAVQRYQGLLAGAEDLVVDPILNLLKIGGSDEEKESATDYRKSREEAIQSATPDVSPLWRMGGSAIAG